MTTDKFLETKTLKLKDPFEGYVIPYAHLKTLLDEYAKIKVNELIKDDVIKSVCTKKLSPEEMATKRLELVRGKNIELWVDGEQTDYWKEVYSLGVNDERNNTFNSNEKN